MSHEMRWAARYAFVDDLWRGRARVFVDRHLQAVLRRTGTGVAHGLDPVLTDLVDQMLPRIGGPDPVWMAVDDPDMAAELARARPGTNFASRDAISDVLRRGAWEVALVDLSELFEDAVAGSPSELAERVAEALDTIGVMESMRDARRCLVLSVPVTADEWPSGLDYEEVTDLVGRQLGGGRVYGLYEPPMVAVVDFADNIDPPADGVDDEVDDLDTMAVELPSPRRARSSGGTTIDLNPAGELEDDVPLIYDNSLGSQEPPLLEFVAVAGGVEYTATLGEGLSLVELPAVETSRSTVWAGVRAQLVQARREADAAAIDRQAQMERADELERENFTLRAQVEEARAEHAELQAEVAEPSDAQERENLDAVLAREQHLRWRIGQLERELTGAQARPVEDLEAEVATLRSRLAMGVNPAATGERVEPVPQSISVPASPINGASGREGAATAATLAVIRALDGLVRRIERGGIGTLQLRGELLALRRRLRSEVGPSSEARTARPAVSAGMSRTRYT